MITLTATIDILNGSGTMSNISNSNIVPNNLSNNLDSIINKKYSGGNPFIIGVSKIGDGSKISSKHNYIVSRNFSNADGSFTEKPTFTINGSNMTAITIEFDTYNNRHPNSITIDGTKYQDDDPIFTLPLESSNTHTVVIDDWNTPNYPLVIQGIYSKVSIDIDRRNIKSLEINLSDRADNRLPSFGIISSSGSIEFIDTNGEVNDYASTSLLQQGLDVTVHLNNTIAKQNETITAFQTAEWQYDSYNKVVTVSLKDNLQDWQNINFSGFSYNPNSSIPINGTALYQKLYNATPSKYKMLSYSSLDINTRNHLANLYVIYPFMESSKLWSAWDKFCDLFQTRIYKLIDGSTTCVYNGGN